MNQYHKIKSDEAFHAARRQGIGASDIPTLAGLNKRWGQTPLTLWREKTGRSEPFAENERTEWGNALEPLVLRKYVQRHYGDDAAQDFYRNATRAEPVSYGPFKVKTEARHPEYKFALSHVDLLYHWQGDVLNPDDTSGEPHIVEAKTSGFYAGKRREGVAFEGYDPQDFSQFGVPDKVFMQVQWQLFTYGVTEATVAVLIDTADYREYGPIIYDPRHVEKSLALAERFWWHVENDVEPAPTTWSDVLSVYPDLENKTAMVSGDAETEARRMIARGIDLKAKEKQIKDELDDIKSGLGILSGDTVEGIDAEGLPVIRKTMNKVLAASDGEILAKFRDQTRDSLSLSEQLAAIEKKAKARAALDKKIIQGKTVTEAELAEVAETDADREVLALEAKLREIGAYKISEAYRVVTY